MEYPNVKPLCECDVSDKEHLAQFRALRRQWHLETLGDDRHSLKNQVLRILWNDMVFRAVNEARRICAESAIDTLGCNTDFLDLFDRGFIATQVMAIRRITDPGFHDPEKHVISVANILKNVQDNIDLITRENYVCYAGSSYESSPGEPDTVPFFRDIANKMFDRMSGKGPDVRSRSDVIRVEFLKTVSQKLSACDSFRNYAKRHIAHASEFSEKRAKSAEAAKMRFEDFDNAYKAIVGVVNFMSLGVLCECELGNVPVPQYDQTEGFDKSLVEPEHLIDIDKFLSRRVDEMES